VRLPGTAGATPGPFVSFRPPGAAIVPGPAGPETPGARARCEPGRRRPAPRSPQRDPDEPQSCM